MKPKSVLYVNGGRLDYGGISSYMLGYAGQFDRSRVAVDFLVHGFDEGAREQEALSLGAKVMHVPHKRADYAGNRGALRDAFTCGGYDIVHAHMDGMNGYALGLARACGVPVRISHSHNTQFLTTNPARVLLHRATASRIPRLATHLFACSTAAGAFLYGKKYVDAGKVSIIKNAVDLERYAFSSAARKRLRAELGLENRFAIGHVGRLDYQKNQAFLLALLPELIKLRPETMLLMVGDGADRAGLERHIAENGLGAHARLLGYRADAAELFSAFDCFALPSRFEGLGIALIEAQRSGLSCIASTNVPLDTRITDCRYLPLEAPEAWIHAFAHMPPRSEQSAPRALFERAGYDIHTEAEKLQSFYEGLKI